MRQTRVTLTLRVEDPEDPGEFMSEWIHEREYQADEVGCYLDWGYANVWYPWSSVLSVRRETCFCSDCNAEADDPS